MLWQTRKSGDGDIVSFYKDYLWLVILEQATVVFYIGNDDLGFSLLGHCIFSIKDL